MPLKDWILIAGILVIFLFALSSLSEPGTSVREKGSGAGAGYGAGILVLLCLVNFFEFRRGATERLGLSETWSWVLAPIGLIIVITASIVSWWTSYGEGSDDKGWWWWVSSWVFFLGVVAAYLAVAVGPSAFI